MKAETGFVSFDNNGQRLNLVSLKEKTTKILVCSFSVESLFLWVYLDEKKALFFYLGKIKNSKNHEDLSKCGTVLSGNLLR